MKHTPAYGSRSPELTAGSWLAIVGALHQIVGLAVGIGLLPPYEGAEAGAPLLGMLRAGVIGAVEPHPDRMVLFWFLATGFGMLTTGWLAHVLERRGALPRSFGAVLGALSLAGGVLIPVSGLWLGLVPAVLAWRRGTRASS
jgi:hypothetical protein